MLIQCNPTKQRLIQRHVWEEYKEQVARNRQSAIGKMKYKWRCQTIERSFTDAKVLHGLLHCRFRGKAKTQEQVLMTAIAQNIKKIARHLTKQSGQIKNQLIANYKYKFRISLFPSISTM
jgi:fatty acid/phospholipid biosynthesis enzyme